MLKRVLMICVVMLVGISSAYAVTFEGVDMPDTLTIGGEQLLLNGVGVRTKRIIFLKNIYVAGLYLKAKSSDAAAIINADETMVLRIKIVTSLVTSERFTEATEIGFREATGGNTAPIEKEIKLFLNTFSDKINDGDLFDIVYRKGVGVQTFKNGGTEPIVTIPGMPVKSALFGIWLSDRTETALQVLARGLLGVPEKK